MALPKGAPLATPGRRPIGRPEAPPHWQIAAFAFAALLVLTMFGPLMTMLYSTGQSVLRQLGYVTVAALGIFAARPLSRPERLLVVPWPLVLALGWCWLSMIWAFDPAIGSRRLVLTTVVIVSIFVLVQQLGHDRVLLIVRVVLGVSLAANFLTVLLAPALGIHGVNDSLAGDWRGFMAHKNVAGQISALTVLFFAFDTGRLPRPVQIAVVVLAAGFLVLSNSKTSMGVCVAALLVGFACVFYLPRAQIWAGIAARYPAVGWAVLGVLVAVMALVFLAFEDDLNALLADPAAFTGRTLIWQPLARAFLDHPFLGVGYGSFWDLGTSGPLYHYATVDWVGEMSQAHNGYLDMLVQIGVPGLMLVVFAAMLWPIWRLLRSPGIDRQGAGLVAALVLFGIGHNFTESSLFDRDSAGQVFLILAIALLRTLGGAGSLRMPVPPLAPPRPARPSLRIGPRS